MRDTASLLLQHGYCGYVFTGPLHYLRNSYTLALMMSYWTAVTALRPCLLMDRGGSTDPCSVTVLRSATRTRQRTCCRSGRHLVIGHLPKPLHRCCPPRVTAPAQYSSSLLVRDHFPKLPFFKVYAGITQSVQWPGWGVDERETRVRFLARAR